MSQYYDAAQMTLKSTPIITEMYIPLWVADGTTASCTQTTANFYFLLDGANANTKSTSAVNLHTLNAGWPPSTKFAFEATLYTQVSSATAYVALYDMTSNAQVAASQLSTTSTTATTLRSSQFTLTPGHVYGVTLWTSNNAYYVYVSDAHLIVFGS